MSTSTPGAWRGATRDARRYRPGLRRLFFLLPLFALTAGCEPGEDPNLYEDCSKRKPAEVIVGTGQYAFEPIDHEVELTFGPQGGAHIWFSLRTRNIGPFAVVHLGVRDVETGMTLSQPGIKAGARLLYNAEEEADEVSGLYGYLNDVFLPEDGAEVLHVSDLRGRKAALWANVDDHCKAGGKGEVEATIRGEQGE